MSRIMRIPNADQAIISRNKLRDYLLSPKSPQGRYKARFFAGLGYTGDTWRRFEADLRSQHLNLDAVESGSSEHGRKFAIAGRLTGPSGRSAEVLSVWIIDQGGSVPRFVTAYPARRKSR